MKRSLPLLLAIGLCLTTGCVSKDAAFQRGLLAGTSAQQSRAVHDRQAYRASSYATIIAKMNQAQLDADIARAAAEFDADPDATWRDGWALKEKYNAEVEKVREQVVGAIEDIEIDRQIGYVLAEDAIRLDAMAKLEADANARIAREAVSGAMAEAMSVWKQIEEYRKALPPEAEEAEDESPSVGGGTIVEFESDADQF